MVPSWQQRGHLNLHYSVLVYPTHWPVFVKHLAPQPKRLNHSTKTLRPAIQSEQDTPKGYDIDWTTACEGGAIDSVCSAEEDNDTENDLPVNEGKRVSRGNIA